MPITTKAKPTKSKSEFPFGDKNRLREVFYFSDQQLLYVRKKLPSPIYFFQVERKYYYNLELIKHYFLVGGGADHDRLVQAYLATLPRVS